MTIIGMFCSIHGDSFVLESIFSELTAFQSPNVLRNVKVRVC